MQVDAGELNRRIEIFRKEAKEDADGYAAESLELVRACYAKFTRKSGSEMQRSDSDMTNIQVRFLVRWSSIPIDRKMIVRYAGTDYEIEFINDYNDAHEYQEIWCKSNTRAR